MPSWLLFMNFKTEERSFELGFFGNLQKDGCLITIEAPLVEFDKMTNGIQEVTSGTVLEFMTDLLKSANSLQLEANNFNELDGDLLVTEGDFRSKGIFILDNSASSQKIETLNGDIFFDNHVIKNGNEVLEIISSGGSNIITSGGMVIEANTLSLNALSSIQDEYGNALLTKSENLSLTSTGDDVGNIINVSNFNRNPNNDAVTKLDLNINSGEARFEENSTTPIEVQRIRAENANVYIEHQSKNIRQRSGIIIAATNWMDGETVEIGNGKTVTFDTSESCSEITLFGSINNPGGTVKFIKGPAWIREFGVSVNAGRIIGGLIDAITLPINKMLIIPEDIRHDGGKSTYPLPLLIEDLTFTDVSDVEIQGSFPQKASNSEQERPLIEASDFDLTFEHLLAPDTTLESYTWAHQPTRW
jgi:hypothetical protein